MKAQSELNWVFIIVAGAIILAFFTGFAFKYKDLQEEKLSIELLNTLDNTLTSFKTSPYKTFDIINLPTTVKITCNQIQINDKSYQTNNLLFSPVELRTKLLVYYRPFKIPFKVADFYLITDANKKYHLITDSTTEAYIVDLINNLPDDLKNKFSSSNLQKNEPNTKNIQIRNLNNNFINVNNQQIYLNGDLVLAAIFSDNFNCMYDKIKQEMNNVVKVYENKARLIHKENCNYNSFLPYLNDLKQLNFNSISSIDAINQELANNNCPVLY